MKVLGPKVSGTIVLTVFSAVFLAGTAIAGPASVGLGTAESFAVLASSTITNTGPTTINGDVGLHPGSAVTGFDSVTLNGTLHVADDAAQQAQADLTTAYNDAAGRTPVTTVGTELGNQILTTGVYDSADGTFGLTGTLTLNAEGDPNAVFIFQAASTLKTASGSSVALVNGAQACNVFWKVGSSGTLGTATSFKGNILASETITMNTGATLEGRALARGGAVTLATNVITKSACSTPPPTLTTNGGTTPAPTAKKPARGSAKRRASGTATSLPATGNTIPAWPSMLLAIFLIYVGIPMARMSDAQAAFAWRAMTYKPRHRKSRISRRGKSQ